MKLILITFLTHLISYGNASPAGLSIGKEKVSLSSVLEYYRTQNANSGPPKDSGETESVEVEIPKKVSYRLELSGDETSPYASYQFEEKAPEIIVQNSSVSETEAEATTIYPIENVTGTGKQDLVDEFDMNESIGDECTEGELKKVDCNTCVCSDGSFFCSKKKCPTSMKIKGGIGVQYYEDSFLSHEALAEKKEQMVASMNLMNNKSWKKKMQATTPLPDCTSGMSKSIDCNQCVCVQQKWACTKRSCIALSLREKASYTDGSIIKQVETLKENHNLDEDCLDDETKQIGCNHCVCHYNSWSCTNVTCSLLTTAPPTPMEEIEEACQKEGDMKSKECNACKCRRGVWVCTMNDCQALGDKTGESQSFRSSLKIIKEKDI